MKKPAPLPAFLVGSTAFVFALLGQFGLRSPLRDYAWILYFGAAAAFVLVFRNRTAARLAPRVDEPGLPAASFGIDRLGLLRLSAAATLTSFALFFTTYRSMAWLVHLLGILLFIAAFLRPARIKVSVPVRSLIALSAILLLAGALRFWELDSLPFGTWYDEAFNGNLALRILSDPSFRPIFDGGDTLPSHLAYLFALSFRLFGASTESMRFVTAAFGVLTVLFAYLLFRRWFGEQMGLVAAFLFAVLRYDITFSRIAMHGVTTPAFELASLYLLDRALEHRRPADFAWLGLTMGFGLAFYTPFRLFPLIVLAFLLLLAGVNRWRQRGPKEDTWYRQAPDPRWKRQFAAGLGVLLLGMFSAISPVVQFALQHGDVFTARTSAVSIFERRDEPDLAKALWNNTTRHLLMFNVQGDRNGRHNWPGQPMLDPVMGALFVLGLGYGLWRWRDPSNLLMLSIFGLMNMGGILSVDFEAPQSLRSIGVMPALVYFAVLPLALLTDSVRQAGEPALESGRMQARIGQNLRSVFYPALLCLLAVTAYLNIDTYFNKQVHSPDVWAAHSAAETIVSNEMKRLAGSHDFVLSAMYDNHPTVRFLAGSQTGYRRWTSSDRLPLVRTDMDRGVAMLFDGTLLSTYHEARRYYPNAEFVEHRAPAGGGNVLYEVILSPEDLRAVSGVVARYYAGGLEGEPVREETLASASVDWTETQPLPEAFLADLHSTLYVTKYGPHSFRVHGVPEYSLWIDGFPVGDGPLMLARGNHDLRIQVPGVAGRVELWWQPPGAAQEEPLPGAYLFRPPVTNSGLLGAYYPSPDWSGDPAFLQVDPEIAFYFHIIPLPRPYTVQWTGRLFAPEAGDYLFALKSVDGSQLMLNGQLVVDNPEGRTTVENRARLTAGWHDITVRFSDRTSSTQIYLYWTPPGAGEPEIIPTRYLSPPMGEVPMAGDAGLQDP